MGGKIPSVDLRSWCPVYKVYTNQFSLALAPLKPVEGILLLFSEIELRLKIIPLSHSNKIY